MASLLVRRMLGRRPTVVSPAILFAALLLTAIAAPGTASGPDGIIQGYVRDAGTLQGVPGALVRIESNGLPYVYELPTDGTGFFQASVVPLQYNFMVIADGYQFFFAPVSVGSLQVRWVNASLSPAAPRDALVKGYVNDTSTGSAITVGRVVAVPPGGPMGGYVNASPLDSSGYYELGLVPGDYQIFTDSTTGYFGSQAFVSLSSGQIEWLNFSLSPNPFDALIAGTVYEAANLTPVSNATVSVRIDNGPSDSLYLPSVTTDASGLFAISVPSGFATITVNKVGYGPDTEWFSIAANSTTYWNFTLRPIQSTLAGYAYDMSNGAAIPNVTVSVSDWEGFYEETVTDSTGFYAMAVPEGCFSFQATAAGYYPYFEYLCVPPAALFSRNFTMAPVPPVVATVQGYLVDASTAANLPNMTVFVFDIVSGFFNATISDSGGFYSLGVVESPILFLIVPAQGNYAGGQASTSASPGDVKWVNVTVYPLNATVQFIVTDALTGLPIPGADVYLSWGFSYSVWNVTDANGIANVASPATTDVSVSVYAGGYIGYSESITVLPGLNVLDVVLVPLLPVDVLVRGYILDNSTAMPIPGASVVITGYDGWWLSNSTDPSGYYEIWTVAYPQEVRASQFDYVSNSTAIAPSPGETLWVNMSLDPDPNPPEITSFTATPPASVSPFNPTTFQADVVEQRLESANLYLLRQMALVGNVGTFMIISSVDPADVTISEPSPGNYAISSLWDARAPGGWIGNGTTSEWWPAMAGPLPGLYGILGLWQNATIPGPDYGFAIFDASTGQLLVVSTSSYGVISPASQPDSTFTPWGWGLEVDTTSGQILGPSSSFGSAYPLAGLSFTYDDVVPSGAYAGHLELVDSAGHFNDSIAFVKVDTTPPVADAGGPYSVTAGLPVMLDGTASTDNVGIANYTWTFDDGGPRELYGATPTYTFATPGTYVVTLTVRDAAGNTDEATVVVTVNADTLAPAASAGPDQTVDEDTLVTFDGSASTDNVAVVNYTWTFTDGTPKVLYESNPSYVFGTPGVYIVTLTVRDAAGNSGTDTVTITVLDVTSPIANAGPDQTVDEDTLVTFDGSASTDNVGIANYTWTFDDGGPRELYGATPTYTFATPGTYVVTLTVRDAAGNTATDSLTVTVRDVTAPTVSIDSPAAGATVSGTITIAVSANDNVGVVRAELRVDGDLVATDTSAPFSFSLNTANYSDGTHTIRVTVYDAAGNSAFTERTVTVSNPVPTGGLGLVEYGLLLAGALLAAALIAWMILRRRRRPSTAPPSEGPGEPTVEEQEPLEDVDKL